jgi:DNA-binding LacI/PurR family transcriptional regulator
VGLNTYRGGELAAEHFINLGYHEAGVHPSIIGTPRCEEPVEEFKRTMEKHGVPVTDLVTKTGNRTNRGRLTGHETEQILDGPPRALFIPDDVAVYGLLASAARCNIRVPEDVAVIGFDDIYTFPEPNRLTTLYHPFIEKGEAALQMLLRLMDDPEPVNGDYHELIDPVLMVRETCGGKPG